MANIYNDDDNLYWVFTNYGKQRLASLSADDHLFLYKAGIGSYNWYTDENNILGGYTEAAFKAYFNEDENKDLALPIDGGKVAINSKSLEDDNVVVLTVTIPETLSGFDIREFAIYETVNNVDYLFAICTMQAVPKPSVSTNHRIAVQFNARLQSEMLANAYDQIVLDPNNNFATVEELNSFQENLLFVETNLAEQISNNARIIGYNRPQQLYEEIQKEREYFSNTAISTALSNITNVTSLANIKSFWVFKPNNDATKLVSITDMSYYGINMATDKLVTLYDTGYEGLGGWLNFEYNANSNTGNYYMLDSDVDFDFVNTDDEGNVSDAKFSLFVIGSQNTNSHECTLMAKDNSAQTNDVNPAYKISITPERQVRVRLYSDRNNYVEYLTGINSVPEAGKFYVMSITYNPIFNEQDNIIIPRFNVMINGKDITGNIIRVGSYTGMPKTVLPLTSRVRTANDYTDYVDSKMCLLSLIKDELTPDYIRAITYGMMAYIGVNPCLIQ